MFEGGSVLAGVLGLPQIVHEPFDRFIVERRGVG
jgi:hypothetical protein